MIVLQDACEGMTRRSSSPINSKTPKNAELQCVWGRPRTRGIFSKGRKFALGSRGNLVYKCRTASIQADAGEELLIPGALKFLGDMSI